MLTYTDLIKGFDFGRWHVVPERDVIIDGEDERHIEPIVMNVFVVLASHGGGVVTKDQLIDAVWDGRPQADEVITRCISALRRSLGDNAKTPQFIETLQKRGYRVMQRVRLPDATEPEKGNALGVRPVHLGGTAMFVVVAFVIYWFWPANPISPHPDTPVESIAVYPFDCRFAASNPAQHLCYGFAAEAIGALKRIPDLSVVQMRQPFGGTPPGKVHAVVTGSVQIIGNQLRITAILEDMRSGLALRSISFDATRATIFDVQKQVADALANALDVNAGASPTNASSTPGFDAKMAYSLGRSLFEKRDHKSTVDAIAQFEEAIRLNRDYGSAWLALAYSYVNWPDYDFTVDREAMYDKALEVVGQGIEADPRIREAAGTVYGFVYHKRNQWIAAADAFEMAINAEDEQPMAYHWYSYMLASAGRLDAAYQHAQYAWELDPQNPAIISRVAITALYNNDNNTAGRYFATANRMGLENFGHMLMYSLYLYRTGQVEDAKVFGKHGFALNDVDADWFHLIVDGSRDAGQREMAVQTLSEVSAMNVLPANVEMFFWILLDEVERAMEIARRLETEVGLYEPELMFTKEFTAMRRHPDFDDLTRAIGLTEYWDSVNCALSGTAVWCPK